MHMGLFGVKSHFEIQFFITFYYAGPFFTYRCPDLS